MSSTWLLVDTHNAVWRAYHGQGATNPESAAIGAVRDMNALAGRLGCFGGSAGGATHRPRIAWMFDSGPYHRTKLHPGYKANRPDTPERRRVRGAIDTLKEHMSQDQIPNVFVVPGHEADDLMAAVQVPPRQRVIMASDDRDLYQLLDSTRAIHHLRKRQFFTALDFKRQFGLPPRMWTEVKALAGCPTDNVPGMKGVAEQTALQFFRGAYKGTAKHEAILAHNRSPEYTLARKLVALPFTGCAPIELDDTPPPRGWMDALSDAMLGNGVGT